MDKVVHDTGLSKDQEEYIRDNTPAQRVIPGGSLPIFSHYGRMFSDAIERAIHKLLLPCLIVSCDGCCQQIFFDTLKPICVQVQVTFEDHDRVRKEEIDALQEAHSLLDQLKNESWKQRNEELTSDMEDYFCKMQTVKVCCLPRSDLNCPAELFVHGSRKGQSALCALRVD